MENERGSALVITLMLLLILTAIGIYAINISTTDLDVTLQSKVGTVTLNAAEAGTYVAIDQVPNIVSALPGTLSNSASYTVTSLFTGEMSIVPGYGVNYRFANFRSDSQGSAPPPFVAQRTIVAVTNFGPIPIGTMY